MDPNSEQIKDEYGFGSSPDINLDEDDVEKQNDDAGMLNIFDKDKK